MTLSVYLQPYLTDTHISKEGKLPGFFGEQKEATPGTEMITFVGVMAIVPLTQSHNKSFLVRHQLYSRELERKTNMTSDLYKHVVYFDTPH